MFATSGRSHPSVRAHFEALAAELKARNHRSLFVLDPQGSSLDASASPIPFLVWPSPVFRSWDNIHFLLNLVLREKPDCLVANFSAVNLLMGLGWLLRVPCRVAWVHSVKAQHLLDSGYRPDDYELRIWRRRLFFKAATHIAAVSKDVCEDAFRCLGGRREKYHAFYLSCSQNKGSIPSVSGAPGFRLICPARMVPSKGQEILIRAAALLMDIPELKIEFAGDGVCRANLENMARQLGLGSICSFLGNLKQADILRKMASAQATVVPSLADAMPLVVAESLSVGTPVIGSRVNGIPEAVENEVNGFLFEAGNARALAEKIRAFFSNPRLRACMREASQRTFLERFSERAVIPQQASWLEEITSRRK